MTIDDALRGVALMFLDTAPVIYYVEGIPGYLQVLDAVFQRIRSGIPAGAASPVTLAECLVLPFRAGSIPLQQAYFALLVGNPNIGMVPIDAHVGRMAAELRARYNLNLPDALQVAAALSFGCDALLTNDAEFRRVSELRILVLDDLEL